SLMEGFGLPVIEAMSHGTPVIVSAIPPLLEVAGGAAIPIEDPEDVESIARAMVAGIEEPRILEGSAELGPSTASRFNWTTAAETLVALWTEVLAA
ncbi:MAG: glycosyltransferase, partial [Thermoanaerobaculia bacterium]|nr:glycosyltransferase [Thermoanaerobaculia bacterium]